MGKKPNHAALLGVAGLLGLGILWYASDVKQRRRERNAFDEIDASNLTPRQIWDKALEFGRNERMDLRGELDRANKILERANDMCEVNEGLRKCVIMAADESVPQVVKESVLQHWMKRFFNTFGPYNEDVLEAIFSDEKLATRIGKLAGAQEQYESWLAELKKPYDDEDGDGLVRCSFCGKTNKEVEVLIAGPNKVHICNECVDLSGDVLKERRGKQSQSRGADHPHDRSV